MAHNHDVYDMENHFEINGSSRFIKETSETKLVVVQGDHKSEVLTFKMPRYIDGHDMTLCNKIRIHYINLETKTNNKSADVYEVTDLTPCEECEDVLTFTWTIEAPATKYSGTLSFLVKFECTEGENVLYQWNTAKYVSVNVLAGIDNSEEFVEKYSNVLEEWYNELTKGADSIEELNQKAIAEIELAKEDAKEDIQGKADATMAEIKQCSTNTYNSFKNNVDAKAKQTLASIPEDYSDLDARVKTVNHDLSDLQDDIASQLPFNVNALKDSSWEFGYRNPSTGEANGNKGYMMTKESISVVGGSKIVISKLPSEVRSISIYVFNENGYKEEIGVDITEGATLSDDIISIRICALFTEDLMELPIGKPKICINPVTSFEEMLNEVKEEVSEEIKNEIGIVEKKLDSLIEKDHTKSYFYYHITSTYFDFRNIHNHCSGATFVDWGDGTTTEITTGDDELKHHFPSVGDYVITVSGLTSINARAFKSHTGLYKAILSNAIESIGTYAFSENADDFSSIEFTSESPITLVTEDMALISAKTIYIPTNSLLKYAEAWDGVKYNNVEILSKVQTKEEVAVVYSNKVVTVGNGGDYATIKEALMYFSSVYPIYKKGGVTCEIKILSGTTITEQIYVERIDLQYITITSEDEVVLVNCDGWVETADFHDSRADYPFIAGENGAGLPTIGTVFQLVTNTNNIQTVGYLANRGSNGVVLSNSGFDGFYDGVIANNESSVTIREGISRNMTRWGIHSRHNGEISARSIIATNCGVSAYADRIGDLDVREADLSGSTVAICGEHTSRINANGCHANNCGSDTDYIVKSGNGSVVNCTELEVTNAVGNIFEIHDGGTLIAFLLNTTGLADDKKVFFQNVNTVSRNGIIYS